LYALARARDQKGIAKARSPHRRRQHCLAFNGSFVWSREGPPAMRIRIKSSQDFATGLLFLIIGIGAYYIGSSYSMGIAQRPGTGVLPRILAWCLIGSGVLMWIKAFTTEGEGIGKFAWRPLVMVTVAVIAFSLLIDRAGLVVAMIVSMMLAALGTHETRWREFAMFMVLMLAVGLGLFIYGLGMPIKVWPWS
jgi:Tripartite tricarboxylate transporter TctB family